MADGLSDQIRAAAAVEDWARYFQLVRTLGPRPLLLRALELMEGRVEGGALAVDLGCGEGRDTTRLLEDGWRVVALDASTEAFEHLGRRVDAEQSARLECVLGDFEDLNVRDAALVNAAYCLPFCPPDRFDRVWDAVVSSIRPGGWFCGQFFGDRHRWASIPGRSHHTRQGVEQLLSGFSLEFINEDANRGASEPATPNDWHVIDVIARKGG